MELIVLLLCVAVVWLWIALSGARKGTRALAAKVDALGKRVVSLEQRQPSAAPDAARAEPAAAPAQPPAGPSAVAPPRPPSLPQEVPLETIAVSPPSAPRELPPPRPAAPAAGAPAAPAAPRPPAAPLPPPPPRRPTFDLAAFLGKVNWEQWVGVKLFSVAAGLLVALAAVFFVRWSIDAGLITPPIRMAGATLFGLALVALSETRFARSYRLTAQSLIAGGIATLFATFFAARVFWHLTPAWLTFLLLVLVTAAAVLLAIRQRSLVIAVLGLLGGFATPILVSTGENNPWGLFGYLLLLTAGLAWVSYQRRWPILSALSLAFTALYQAGWVARFLDLAQLPLALGIFLVFPLVGFAGLWLAQRKDPAAPSPLHRWAAALGALPPALFVLYAAATADLAPSWPLVLGFLAVVAAGLAAVAAWQGPEWLHLAGGATSLLTVSGFLAGSFTAGDWPLLAAFLALLMAVYLGAPLLLARLGRDFRQQGRLGVLAAPLLLAAFAGASHVETAASPAGFLLPLLLLAAAGSAWAVLRSDAVVHALSSAMAILAAAAWSWFHLDAANVYPGLLAYAALGGLFLAAPLWADRRGKPLTGAPAGPLLLGGLALLGFLAHRPVAGAAIGSLLGLTVLAILFQAALFAEAARGRRPLLALAGVLIGFLELALWALTGLAAALLPALIAGAALAGVALAGALLVAPRLEAPGSRGLFRAAPFLGLAGHLLVVAVAAQRDLALPPTPWLAVLGVLDLGFLVAALLRRRTGLLVGAAAATVLVLLAHLLALGMEAPAPLVAGGAAVAAAALSFVGFLLARRLRIEPARSLGPAGIAALVALHGAQLVLILAGGQLSVGFLVPAHLALGFGLLALAWLTEVELIALSAAILGGLAAPARWTGPESLLSPAGGAAAAAGAVLWLATPALLLALAYPLVRGARGLRERLTFVSAAVASAIYLLVARQALVALGAGPYLGVLPVLQAALLVPHLRLLLRMEPPSQRDLARLATVAASVLGLVTVAIPLQLDKQWWTIGWALLAAALAWLWRKVPHRGLLVWSLALFGASFVRLIPGVNPWIFEYAARGQTPILNWFLYAYLMVAGAHFLGAWLLSGGQDRPWERGPRLSTLASAAGAVLLFFLLNIEIADYWAAGPRITFRFSAGLAPDLSYTIGWALFAIGLLVAGVFFRNRGPRFASIALLVATILKAFLHDLGRLSGLYRVASLIGLAVSLAVVAVVLQKFVLRAGAPRSAAPEPQPPAAPPPTETP